jgi:glycerol-3-phosphate dehydrogenase
LQGLPEVKVRDIETAEQQYNLSRQTVNHLVNVYGAKFHDVLKYVGTNKVLGNQISQSTPDILAQIQYAVDEESALTLNDFMLRRTNIGWSPMQGRDAIETVASNLGLLLGWSAWERMKQVDKYHDFLNLCQKFRTESSGSQKLTSH